MFDSQQVRIDGGHAIRSVTRHGQAERNRCIKLSDNIKPDLDAVKRPDIEIQSMKQKLDTVTTVTPSGELPRT